MTIVSSGAAMIRRCKHANLRAAQRFLVDRLDVNVGAVEHREPTIASLEGEKQIRAAKEDDFRAPISAQFLTLRERIPVVAHR